MEYKLRMATPKRLHSIAIQTDKALIALSISGRQIVLDFKTNSWYVL